MEEKKKKTKRSHVILIILAIAVPLLILIAAGVAGVYWWNLYNSTGSNTVVSEGVYVNDIDLGGMTMDEAQAAIESIERQLASQVKVDITADKNEYHLTDKEFPCSFNGGEVLEQIKEHSAEKAFNKPELHCEITMETDTSKIPEIADTVEKDVYTEPVDAKVKAYRPFGDEVFTYWNEKPGKQLDKDDLIRQLNAVFKNGGLSGKITAKVDDIEPDMTADYLQNHIVKLSSFSTTSTNNANGNENMRISLKACNGSIIDPGAVWSFNGRTGDSNLASNGYKPAGVLINGRSETGIGGGICQSSTTIYNAALLSGMEVVERYCHYYKSTYVDAGRDATIDYGNLDLKLTNPFDTQLFMKCWMDGVELHCEIYGLDERGFDQIKISTSKPEQHKDSYTVKAWRTYYLYGEKLWTQELPESTYYTKAS
jgi:vancomycin resistance protein YoaR